MITKKESEISDQEWKTYTECIIYINKDKEYRQNGKSHREDGPAIERANGHKVWCLNGQIHRVDGPAVVFCDGTKKWWYRNQYCKHITTQEQFESWLKVRAFE